MYTDFEKWCNKVIEENFPIEGEAICFNIYEESDKHWSIQLISASYFDEDDSDWACEEVFTTGENLFSWAQDSGWAEILDVSCDLIHKYLNEGRYSEKLKEFQAVAAGFVDGDLEILYKEG